MLVTVLGAEKAKMTALDLGPRMAVSQAMCFSSISDEFSEVLSSRGTCLAGRETFRCIPVLYAILTALLWGGGVGLDREDPKPSLSIDWLLGTREGRDSMKAVVDRAGWLPSLFAPFLPF